MATAYWTARLAKTEALIVIYEDAITAIGAGVQSYTFDTGQTRQTVTKLNLSELQRFLDGLYVRRDVLASRCNGTGGTHGGAAW